MTQRRNNFYKMTPEAQETILRNLRAGAYPETAAAAAGVTRQQFGTWMRRAGEEIRKRRDTPGYKPDKTLDDVVQFSERVAEAQAQAELLDVAVISRAAQDGAWQAAAWKLERRYPEKYGRRLDAMVSGKPGGEPIRVEDARQRLDGLLDKYDEDQDE